MSAATRIAVVDDDAVSREAVAGYLKGLGYEVQSLDGARALRAAMERPPGPELVILDLVMPVEDGLSTLRWLRSVSDIPVIMLTSNADTTDRVVGLELGADDYVAKPADMRELLARVRSVMRRRQGSVALKGDPHRSSEHSGSGFSPASSQPGGSGFSPTAGHWFGRWRLDRSRRRLVDADGQALEITGAEYGLLAAFADHPNVVLSREKLLELSGTDPGEVFDRAIDLRITRLRKKIEPVPGDPTVIRTVRGHGGGYEYVPSAGPDYGR